MKPILKRRSAKYVEGGFRVCYNCGYNTPDEVHHTSYFPEECIAVCSGCHGYIHSDNYDGSLEPDQPRPDDYEKQRRRAEANGGGYGDMDADNAVHRYIRERSKRQAKTDSRIEGGSDL